jgi:hypothetical protein
MVSVQGLALGKMVKTEDIPQLKDLSLHLTVGVRQSFALDNQAGFDDADRPMGIRRQGWLAAGGWRPWAGLLALGVCRF